MVEKFKFILYVLRRLVKASSAELSDISSILQLTQKNHSQTNSPEKWLQVNNSSGGIRLKTLELAMRASDLNSKWLFVSEPVEIVEIVETYLKNERKVSVLEELLEVEWLDSDFNYDLCSTQLDFGTLEEKFDVVLSQSLLEHVVDPVQVIRNMTKMLKNEGVLIVQTHNRLMLEHYYPIDTLRYNDDFFQSLKPYTNLTCLSVHNSGNAITAVLQVNRTKV